MIKSFWQRWEHNLRKIDGQSHLWFIKFKWMINTTNNPYKFLPNLPPFPSFFSPSLSLNAKLGTHKIMDFEARRRRLAVLCAHLCPSRFDSRHTHIVSTSNCSSNTSNLQLDCVFCQIIQGYSPAFKVHFLLSFSIRTTIWVVWYWVLVIYS